MWVAELRDGRNWSILGVALTYSKARKLVTAHAEKGDTDREAYYRGRISEWSLLADTKGKIKVGMARTHDARLSYHITRQPDIIALAKLSEGEEG